MEFNFKGKKALVTGGGSGLGRECAILFAKNGADVLVADLIPERCEEVATEIRKYGVKAIAYQVDVTNQNGDLIATFESSVFRKDQKVPFTL